MRLLATGWLFVHLYALSWAHVTFSTEHFASILDANSGVLRSLNTTADGFDFSPSDVFDQRNFNGNYHTGDITLRYRVGNGSWIESDSASNRTRVSQTTTETTVSAQLDSSMPNISHRLSVKRTWHNYDGDLALNFTITNQANESIEIGSVGFPIEFNNIFTGRSSIDTADKCVFVDPFIGLQAGYLQVTRLRGIGPHLVVTPLGLNTSLEAWRFLSEPTDTKLAYQSQTFEGYYEWQVHTQAYAEQEWKDAQPWNEPTSRVLTPGESVTYGLRFTSLSTVEEIESTVASLGLPVAVGLPGYVLPRDLKGRLFVNTTSNVSSVKVSPESSLSINYTTSHASTWQEFALTPAPDAFGRSRIELTPVLQESRVWIAGLSDDGGAGSYEAAAMKQSVQPSAAEVAKLEQFVNETVWARLQLSSGPQQYGVKKSLFYYDPDVLPDFDYSNTMDWQSWTSWNKPDAYLLDRTYNYVHVSCLHWSLYRAGRAVPSVLTMQSPEWYLLQSYKTVLFAFGSQPDGSNNTSYRDVGLMGETVWKNLITDLQAESYTSEATSLQDAMKPRAQLWATQEDPFGSEQAWDCTGQEGVYVWSKYFGFSDTVNKTIDSIHGYMPSIAHWGWNGNARRYWDFTTAGKTSRIERQIHHYGSSLNALPLLDNYRSSPYPSSLSTIYSLRVGYGGHQGPLTSIAADGFASMAFHSYPETLEWDAYTGDYGLSFLGHVLGSATYLVRHPVFGWVCFGGNLVDDEDEAVVTVEPRDTVRQRIYISTLGLYVSLTAGTIQHFTLSEKDKAVSIQVSAAIPGPEKLHVSETVVQYSVTRTSENASAEPKIVEDGDGLLKSWVSKYYKLGFGEGGDATITFEW
ncbi:hypothetical protein ASPWEDRAFT_50028 [Aspergillus wentii DTO 134E9]|uniref:Uncharacterized protein n=1 Tax=Aspergillus wentii DTO 134E9 TaxID=1073089 RepID=A0A1L9RNN6_ASPWE|nr:uncharacterized protein ASPWEDRAFT_50028 [Aspergillus wentii DTO 134E9]OJJ36565.1 hypothetical protein ASPWEDRAFT_50028 [Aspergillus wentii DTO 134E9]